MDNEDSSKKKAVDKLLVCPTCGTEIIRVGCHAWCMHCGYQEGCGD